MHPSAPVPPGFGTPLAPDLPALRRLLALRFARRAALQNALLDALFGVADLAALGAAQGRRLQALLEARSDEQLEQIARHGHAGRTCLQVRFAVQFDGEPTADEYRAMECGLLALLATQPWPAPTVTVRAVLLDGLAADACPAQETRASARCSPSGS